MSGVAGCGDGLVQGWETIELSKVRAVTHQCTHSTAKGPPFPSLPEPRRNTYLLDQGFPNLPDHKDYLKGLLRIQTPKPFLWRFTFHKTGSRLFIHLDTSHQLTHILSVLTLRTGWRFRMSRIQLFPLTSSGPRGVLTNKQFSSVQLLSCDPMNRSTPGLAVHHQLLEFTQTHVHQVSDAI